MLPIHYMASDILYAYNALFIIFHDTRYDINVNQFRSSINNIIVVIRILALHTRLSVIFTFSGPYKNY
ncbi:MAG: hypothetical protein HPY66_0367 [Firmicutes bacterium]|nr:hypothetical protein [Bacillota bacterium]